MKTTCDFCKTEYKLPNAPNAPVRCAVCGHTWTVRAPRRAAGLMTVVAAATALMAVALFAFVTIIYTRARDIKQRPLIAENITTGTITDDAGVMHYTVDGIIKNRSDEIYGVPNVVVTSLDTNGTPTARQKFMAPGTLLESGAIVRFSYTLTATTGTSKITVELDE